MKLIEIAKGWVNLARATNETREMAARRLEICDTCPFKAQLSGVGVLLVQAVNQEGSIYYCGLCGCPLASKTASPDSMCPDIPSKWGPVVDSYY